MLTTHVRLGAFLSINLIALNNACGVQATSYLTRQIVFVIFRLYEELVYLFSGFNTFYAEGPEPSAAQLIRRREEFRHVRADLLQRINNIRNSVLVSIITFYLFYVIYISFCLRCQWSNVKEQEHSRHYCNVWIGFIFLFASISNLCL